MKTDWKNKVRKISERDRRERPISRRVKPKKIKFYTSEKMEDGYVYLSKKVVDELPSSALAVYPVLCCKLRYDKHKGYDWTSISQSMISQFTGLSRRIVGEGTKKLQELGLLRYHEGNIKGRHEYKYFIDFYQDDGIMTGQGKTSQDNDLFQYYRSIVLNGTWKRLSPDDKRMYFAMRRMAKCYPELYSDAELDSIEFSEFYRDHFSSRKWDILTIPELEEKLYQHVYMSEERTNKSLGNLLRYNLVSLDNLVSSIKDIKIGEYYRVWLRPQYEYLLDLC